MKAAIFIAAALVFAPLAACSDGGDPPADSGSTARDATSATGDAAEPGGDAGTPNADAAADGGEGSMDGAADAGTDSGAPPPCTDDPNAIWVAPEGSANGAGTENDPLASINAALDRASRGQTVLVRSGRYAELVTIPRSGLKLSAACDELPTIDGTGLGATVGEPALISVLDVDDVTISGFELTGLTGRNGNFPAGIWVRGTVHNIVLENNRIHDITAEGGGADSGAHGIAVYGTARAPSENIVVRGNELSNLILGYSEALVINGNVRRFEVTNNIVHDVNNIAFDFIGFESDVCPDCSQTDAITDDVNRARDGRIANNRAFRMTTASNPAYGGEKSAACYYVDGGADLIIEANRAEACDLGVELASEHFGKSTARVTVRNNFLGSNDVTGISVGGYDPGTGAGGGSAKDCTIIHNTIWDSSRNGWAETGVLLQNRSQGNIFKNNIIVASAGSSAIADGGEMNVGNTFDTNIYFGGGVDGIDGGAGSLTVDPMLVAPATGDLHLTVGSMAKDRGEVLPEVLVDIDGDPRADGAPDIGADEL